MSSRARNGDRRVVSTKWPCHTDPSGMVTSFEHDDVGRETSRTMNPQSGSSSSSSTNYDPSVNANVTVETSYNADGNVHKITAKNADTGDQVTEYVYGTTLSDSEIAISLLKRAEVYPDSVDSSARITFEYNRQSQVTKFSVPATQCYVITCISPRLKVTRSSSSFDQGGTIHEYDFNKLSRQTHDRVTALDT